MENFTLRYDQLGKIILATRSFLGISSAGGQHTAALTRSATSTGAFQPWLGQSPAEAPLSLWGLQLPSLCKFLFEGGHCTALRRLWKGGFLPGR